MLIYSGVFMLLGLGSGQCWRYTSVQTHSINTETTKAHMYMSVYLQQSVDTYIPIFVSTQTSVSSYTCHGSHTTNTS